MLSNAARRWFSPLTHQSGNEAGAIFGWRVAGLGRQGRVWACQPLVPVPTRQEEKKPWGLAQDSSCQPARLEFLNTAYYRWPAVSQYLCSGASKEPCREKNALLALFELY